MRESNYGSKHKVWLFAHHNVGLILFQMQSRIIIIYKWWHTPAVHLSLLVTCYWYAPFKNPSAPWTDAVGGLQHFMLLSLLFLLLLYFHFVLGNYDATYACAYWERGGEGVLDHVQIILVVASRRAGIREVPACCTEIVASFRLVLFSLWRESHAAYSDIAARLILTFCAHSAKCHVIFLAIQVS